MTCRGPSVAAMAEEVVVVAATAAVCGFGCHLRSFPFVPESNNRELGRPTSRAHNSYFLSSILMPIWYKLCWKLKRGDSSYCCP